MCHVKLILNHPLVPTPEKLPVAVPNAVVLHIRTTAFCSIPTAPRTLAVLSIIGAELTNHPLGLNLVGITPPLTSEKDDVFAVAETAHKQQ